MFETLLVILISAGATHYYDLQTIPKKKPANTKSQEVCIDLDKKIDKIIKFIE